MYRELPRYSINELWTRLREGVNGDFTINKLLFFNELLNYHVGLFNSNGSNTFKEIENSFFKYLWLYGELFVSKFNGKIQLWEVQQKWNDGIYIDKIQVRLIRENNPSYFQDTKIITLKNNQQGVYVKWEQLVIPAIIKYWEYINTQSDLYTAFKNASITDTKKFIYTINNDSEEIAEEEIKSFLDPSKVFIKNINPFADKKEGIQNLISEFSTGESKSLIAFENLTNLRSFWKDVLGIVVPSDNKKERKNLMESINENYNSENVENTTLKNLNIFAEKWNEIYQDNLSFEENNEILSNTEEKEWELEQQSQENRKD